MKKKVPYRQLACLSLQVRQAGRVVGHVGEHHSLLVVVLAEDFVLTQVEAVAHTKPAAHKGSHFN
jgi:hypothetical protein